MSNNNENTNEVSKMSQENILTLLAFDNESCALLATLDTKLFGSDVYRHIAQNCINYYKTFKQSPGNHLPDLLEGYINHKDNTISEVYRRVIVSLNEIKKNINKEYVLKSLSLFLRTQSLKLGICKAFDYIQSNDIEKATTAILESVKPIHLSKFDIGTIFNIANIVATLNKQNDLEYIRTGIPELDQNFICPGRKRQFTLFALPNIGKSQFLIHMGKMAAMQRLRVVHFSLEMAEEYICRRYIQALFAVGRRQSSIISHYLFIKGEDGKFLNFEEYRPDECLTFEDKKIEERILNLMEDFKHLNIVIKNFPSGFCTIDMLTQYLDMLELKTGFVPDVLIVDYPDLMRVNAANMRTEIGRLFVELRGIAIDRNLYNINVTQCNRAGLDVSVLTSRHLAEDFSKIWTADDAISLNQTKAEYDKGLARLYVEKARDERKNYLIAISQNYSIGQFCISSALMSKTYDSFMGINSDS